MTKTPMRLSTWLARVLMCLALTITQPAWALDAPNWVSGWLGYDTSSMSGVEFESMVCIGSALSMGALITVVGGTAIVIGGHVGTAAGTAIALPVLVSSMWATCSLSRAVIPGVLWLHARSAMLVNDIAGGGVEK